MRDSTGKMGPKIGIFVAILRRGTMANAIAEDCFQCIERLAADVGHVDDEPGKLLPQCAAHETRFAEIQREAFLRRDDADKDLDSFRRSGQPFVAGKSEIVGIARVRGAQ